MALDHEMKPAVSIIIPTFNRRARLHDLLRRLDRTEQAGTGFEVVVTVDGATDGTVEMLRELRTGYPLHSVMQPNSGPAAARNRAIASATGDLLLFLDDDVIPAPDLIAHHLAIHQQDPDAVAIGSLTAPPKTLKPWSRWEAAALERHFRALKRGEKSVTARHFYTGNASVRRRHVVAAGGFDETFRRGEDAELGYRLAERGLRFYFAPAASVEHESDHPFENWLTVSYKYGCQDVAMARDHGRPHALTLAYDTWRQRHPLTRLLARWCVGHTSRLEATRGLLTRLITYDGPLAPGRLQEALAGTISNIQYWQGVAQSTGLGARVWDGPKLLPTEAMAASGVATAWRPME
ncbi:MAG: glycosyltransferase family 2 protein [Chloroflexi bacterium]|nr:glycosyltransferase family 2 protein [Chloroflexota bacterium]